MLEDRNGFGRRSVGRGCVRMKGKKVNWLVVDDEGRWEWRRRQGYLAARLSLGSSHRGPSVQCVEWVVQGRAEHRQSGVECRSFAEVRLWCRNV
jgi:hypothetical protein